MTDMIFIHVFSGVMVMLAEIWLWRMSWPNACWCWRQNGEWRSQFMATGVQFRTLPLSLVMETP
ncbi:hypothetical protein [Aquitalea sp. LB_tupeE]|uniref:hypothetical protein n=1 Tax=Aquitalea sp. LB_tupeE TaxID=2748078 RepID=UPI0015BF642F|nr:hypothetical protein [Aquitalea sp. LB_tupeE]NWK78590.1 hypothetical protein [Aquitalea sp. LB_tupeE]